MNAQRLKRATVLIILAAIVGFGAWHFWKQWNENNKNGYLISGNGRIEAVEIDIATKLPGRIEKVLVDEGDFVQKGQLLAIMQTDTLNAQLAEAEAQYKQAQNSVKSAEAQVAVRKSDVAAANAGVVQREAELDAAKRRLARSEVLSKENASSIQELDDNRAQVRSAKAAVIAAQAQVTAAQAAVTASEAQVIGAKSQVVAVEATIERIRADINDSQLTSPKNGRIQYRIAQPGEVLGAGGKLLNLVDLSDVYMTFFVPETDAGKLAIGQDVHIILDAAPGFVIPAHISFVDSVAQFTPKTVETAKERQKLMFRVKAQIPQELLQAHIDKVKTGLPGLAWLKMDPDKDWPENLRVALPD